jgi:hypothetical protein
MQSIDPLQLFNNQINIKEFEKSGVLNETQRLSKLRL